MTFQANEERQEAEEMKKEMGLGDGDDSLVMMLKVTTADETGLFYLSVTFICFPLQQKQKSREQNFNSFLSDLEAKYSKTSGKSQKARRKK